MVELLRVRNWARSSLVDDAAVVRTEVPQVIRISRAGIIRGAEYGLVQLVDCAITGRVPRTNGTS